MKTKSFGKNGKTSMKNKIDIDVERITYRELGSPLHARLHNFDIMSGVDHKPYSMYKGIRGIRGIRTYRACIG